MIGKLISVVLVSYCRGNFSILIIFIWIMNQAASRCGLDAKIVRRVVVWINYWMRKLGTRFLLASFVPSPMQKDRRSQA